MKIQNEHLRALQENEAQRAKKTQNGEGFDALLSREITANPAQGEEAASAAPLPGLAGPHGIQNPALLEMQAAKTSGTLQAQGMGVLQEATGDMDAMLSMLDNYAGQLALDGKADMREAFSLLEGVSGEISRFKAKYPTVGTEQPELASLVEELDVLATTETFKFNRGDYL